MRRAPTIALHLAWILAGCQAGTEAPTPPERSAVKAAAPAVAPAATVEEGILAAATAGAETYAPVTLKAAREALERGDRDVALGLAQQAREQAEALRAHVDKRVQLAREDEAGAEAVVDKQLEQLGAGVDEAPVALPEGVATVSPGKVRARQREAKTFLLLDVRAEVAYGRSHIEGAASLPAYALDVRPLPDGMDIVLYGQREGAPETARAARVLGDVGRPFEVLEGGFEAWQAAGLPVVVVTRAVSPAEGVREITVEELLATEGATLVDVRPASAFEAGHADGAVSMPPVQFGTEDTRPLPEGRLLVFYASDQRAAEAAARFAMARGRTDVRTLQGGLPAYARAGGRLASGRLSR